ncbi:MAG: MBL fold metallo-hydrolase [Polyangiaceae bacterium]|nr:MBL fold metallo-hydrolase [Polyangiaceae bacterium]
MRVHHFNAGTLCPVGRRLLNGDGSYFERGRLVCHCLLIETDAHGLVLVDTGMGIADCQDGATRLGLEFVTFVAPKLDASECAVRFVASKGFRTEDVRHIILTHMDVDHAGGLPDFPEAKVHVLAGEHAAAMARKTFAERNRYRPCQWAHGPDFALYEPKGEPWRGFSCVRELQGLPPELLLLPLSGHTRGHACVAIDAPGEAYVHAGDAYFHRSSVEREADDGRPSLLGFFEDTMAIDRTKIRGNHQRLHELKKGGNVKLFCAHDPVELDALDAIDDDD